MDISHLRQEYKQKTLDLKDLALDPFVQFDLWFEEALHAKIIEPHAMTLSTVSAEGHPCGRMVLLKRWDDQGFVFFTNYESRKAKQLDAVPFGSLTIFWKELERQVLLEGRVAKTSFQESAAYFAARPRRSQIAAWASPQSQPLSTRAELEQAFHEYETRFEGEEVPCPPFWGGYRLIPDRFEFWQGREDRLHDRFIYQWLEHRWVISRLGP